MTFFKLKDALAKAKEQEDELQRIEEEKIRKEEEARQKKLELVCPPNVDIFC